MTKTIMSIVGEAIFSDDDVYRYVLTRGDAINPVVWIMLNPSTADAFVDDPTIRRTLGYMRSWGYGGVRILNVFALRATDPKELKKVADPAGPENVKFISETLITARNNQWPVICAWGATGNYKGAADTIMEIARDNYVPLSCLKLTKGGHPGHPLYLRGDLQPIPFTTPLSFTLGQP